MTASNDLEAIAGAVESAVSVAQVFLPEYAAFFVLGRAVAKAAPGVYEDVVRLLEKAEPTEEEKEDLARKLKALASPETA